MEFNEITKKIQETRTIVDNTYEGEPRFKPGHDMRRNEALRALPELQKQIRESFGKLAFSVFATGKGAADLANAIEIQTPAISVDVSKGFYDTLLPVLKASIGPSRQFGPSQFSILVRELRQLAAQNDIEGLPSVPFSEVIYVADDAALKAVVDTYVNKMGGALLLGAYITNEASKLAESLEKAPAVVPVVITGLSEDQADQLGTKLFQKKFVVVDCPEEVDEAFAVEVLKNIKKTLKKKNEEKE